MGSAQINSGLCAALSSLGAAFSTLAFAQAPASQAGMESLEEIVVTAQKREQRLQDVPLAVSAFGAEQLQSAQVQTLLNLDGKIPNVILAPVGAFPFAGAFAIRGLGFADAESSFEPTVGVEVNGVYLARNVGTVQDFFDIDQVAVLRGPQGTLYGRNTIGGVVSIRTKRPGDTFQIEGQGTLGNYDRRELRAAIEGPLAPGVLSARVSALSKHYGGFSDNDDGRELGRQNVFGIRGTLAFTPTENLDVTLIVDHSNDTGTGPAFENASLPTQVLAAVAGFPADDDGRQYFTHVGGDIRADIRTTGETLEANLDLGPATLTSITGYRETKTFTNNDFDGEAVRFLDVIRDESHHQFSQELRVASNGDDALTYVFGAYYMTQRYDISVGQFGTVFGSPTAGSTLYAGQTADSYAAFGQVDYKLLPQLTLTAGGRYSRDSKRFTIQPLFLTTARTFEQDFSDFSPKAAISWAWTPDLLTYVQYSQGYRSGGFNGRAGSFTAVGPYGSETVDSYEAGFKSELFERALTLNLAAFTTTYHDMQQSVQQVIPGTTVNQTLTTNAASAKIDGIEAEATARFGGGFTLHAAVGYLDPRFDNFVANLGDGRGLIDRSNLPLSFAPEWTASLTADYSVQTGIGTLSTQVSGRYQSDIYTSFTPLNLLTDNFVREGSTLLDAGIALEGPAQRWRVAVYGKNLTDKTLPNNTFPVATLLSARIYQPPREFGVDLGFKY